MERSFLLPTVALGRFAVVKLWPDIKTAEDECVARLKVAATAIGVECIEVTADGALLSEPGKKVSKRDVDFVLHLHYDTPKSYDAFSIVALWNPLKFYHEWGYQRCSRNLTTHDDFISCSSDAADDHVARMIRGKGTHLPAVFRLYHSTAGVIHPPSLGDCKLFYAGINWEAINGGKSRHQEVLKRLDKTGLLRIYGPTIFSGVRVWAGYESYVREVPFDGVSMIDEISKTGVALVLSSQAHKESALMSNRLFESVAAGALVICDENPFGRRFFGDSLLYIDTRATAEQIQEDILKHLEWARQNSKSALAMIEKAQRIFIQSFNLIRNLQDLYSGLSERKQSLIDQQNPPNSPRLNIRVNLLMPEYSEAVLNEHLQSIAIQEYTDISPVLVVDRKATSAAMAAIKKAVGSSLVPIEVVEIDVFKYGIYEEIKDRRNLGEIVNELLVANGSSDAFMVVAPNESLMSNHTAVLAGALQRDPKVNVASTAAILLNETNPVHSIHEVLDFGWQNPAGPCGFGRFIFRASAIPKDVAIAMPYLDGRCLAVLVSESNIAQQLPATIRINLNHEYPQGKTNEAAESAIIRDYAPRAFNVNAGVGVIASPHSAVPAESSVKSIQILRQAFNRRWLIAQLHALRKQGFAARMQAMKRKLG